MSEFTGEMTADRKAVANVRNNIESPTRCVQGRLETGQFPKHRPEPVWSFHTLIVKDILRKQRWNIEWRERKANLLASLG